MKKVLIKTSLGLPNTCSKCGKPIEGDEWFAENEDFARAGIGYCADCAREVMGTKPASKRAKAKSEETEEAK